MYNKKTLYCGFNPDGSGGGHGYNTISSYLMIFAREQQKLLREQEQWTLRAEIQDPNEYLKLLNRIKHNKDLINYLFEECEIQDVIEEFINFNIF
jgi:hypothetical protein